MSAKDRRKSFVLRLPPPLLPVLRAERRAGREPSAAAALRRLVERQLHCLQDLPELPEAAPEGPAYRLQLPRQVRETILAASVAQHVPPEHLVLRLVASAWRDHSA